MNFVKKSTKPRLYAGNSVGQSRGHLEFGFPGRRFECFEAVGPAREIFNDKLSSEIITYLKDNSDKLLESGNFVGLSLFMVGKSPERSKPIVMFVSEDKASRRDAFKLIRDSGIRERYPGFDLAHIPLKAEFKHLRPLMNPPSDTTKASRAVQMSDTLPMRRISITSGHAGELEARRLLVQDSTGLYGRPRMATAGGLVCFQGQYMFLTVNHCFEDEEDDDHIPQEYQFVEAARRQDDDDDYEIAGLSDLDDDEDEEDIETTSRGSISSPGSQQEELTPSDGYDNMDEAYTVAASIDTSQSKDYALLDALSQLETPVQEHERPPTPSRRAAEVDSIQHLKIAMCSRALDTSLIVVQPSSMEELTGLFNEDVHERVIPLNNYIGHLETQPRDAAIKTITPDGGVIGGTLSGTLSFVRLPHLKSFQKVYTAKFNQPLVPGDCGSWVRDAITGKLFGHVIAGSPSTGLAIIMPASDVFATAFSILSKHREQSSHREEISLTREIGRAIPSPANASTPPDRVLIQEEWILSSSYSSSLRRLSASTASLKSQYQDEKLAANSLNNLRTPNVVVDSHRGVETNHDAQSLLMHGDYSIAWIYALLGPELAAASAMLDEEHEPLGLYTGDDNNYILGRIRQHNVVIAPLSTGPWGNNAANVASTLKHSSPGIRAALMVGIGSGAPTQADVRLGDVVVGTQVMPYHISRHVANERFKMTSTRANVPPQSLLSAVAALQAMHKLNASIDHLTTTLLRTRLLSYLHPCQPDRLFQATFEHLQGVPACADCDPEKLQPRSARTSDNPKFHFGVIASGHKIIENAKVRDDVSQSLSALCLVTEAAAADMLDHLPGLLICGIHNYADSHKSSIWRDYAAAATAAYARQLLEVLPPTAGEPSYTDTKLGIVSKLDADTDSHASERQQQLSRSLNFPQVNFRTTNIRPAHAETWQWLPRHSMYQDWLEHQKQPQHHGILWVRGLPGAGKSTLMKYAEADLRLKNPWATSASFFFFNAEGDYLERSTAGMYGSLLTELLKRHPDLQIVLDDTNILPSTQQRYPNVTALEEHLRTAVTMLVLPSGTIIDAIDEADEQQARDMVKFFRDLIETTADRGDHICILWVLCANRPLSPAEFRHALWAGLLEQGLGDPDLPGNIDMGAIKLVTSSFNGLAEVTRSRQPTVQFFHESVRHFLLKNNCLQAEWAGLGPDPEAWSHERLSRWCATHPSLPEVQAIVDGPGNEDEQNTLAKKYSFLECVSQQALVHANLVVSLDSQSDSVTQLLTAGLIRVINVLEKHEIRRYGSNATPLYVPAYRGLELLIHTQMKGLLAGYVHGERCGYLLFAALANGHKGAVAALLGFVFRYLRWRRHYGWPREQERRL